MRPLIITQNLTVDGRVEMLDDWFDPQAQPADALEVVRRDSASCDALLLGRRTFEDFRGYWPQQTDDATGISEELNALQKYVVSSTLTDPQWENSTVIDADPLAAVRQLMRRPGGEIEVTGSIELCHALIRAGLVTEYRLWTFPHVQGRGRRLFPDECRLRLQLLESLSFSDGTVYSRWASESNHTAATDGGLR